MRFGSVCSGIEAASTAWHPLGWTTAYVAEIEPFPAAVLASRFGAGRPMYMPDPDEAGLSVDDAKARRAAIKSLGHVAWGAAIPNWGDFTKIDPDAYSIDLLVGGTPCQAFSVAGERQSLNDERGNLSLEFVRLVHATKSLRWAVWENVPGVLSTADNAFGCFMGGLVGSHVALEVPRGGTWPSAGMVSGPLGRAAWRVLDAQHFGFAQRRRRVFVVFCPRESGGDPAAILFERQGVPGDFAPGGEAWEGTPGCVDASAPDGGACAELAPTLSARTKGGGGLGTDFDCDGGLVSAVAEIAPTLLGGGNSTGGTRPPGTTVDNADSLIPVTVAPTIARCDATREGSSQDFETTTMIAHTLRADGFDASEDGTGRGNQRSPAPCADPIAFSAKDHGGDASEISPTLRPRGASGSHANGGVMPAVSVPTGVRRLTLRECERLQAFPDDHTLITWRGKPAADGPRYKALGNSMCVQVMHWIGSRIAAFEAGTLDGWKWEPLVFARTGGVK